MGAGWWFRQRSALCAGQRVSLGEISHFGVDYDNTRKFLISFEDSKGYGCQMHMTDTIMFGHKVVCVSTKSFFMVGKKIWLEDGACPIDSSTQGIRSGSHDRC